MLWNNSAIFADTYKYIYFGKNNTHSGKPCTFYASYTGITMTILQFMTKNFKQEKSKFLFFFNFQRIQVLTIPRHSSVAVLLSLCTYGFICGVCFVIITKTRLYNFDPLKLHLYIVKLGFTGIYLIFLISA